MTDVMGKIEFSNGVMQFINCSIPFPTTNGLHIVSSGCGSGKSTMILEIIKEKCSKGILVVVATIEAAEGLGRKTEEWIGGISSFHRPKLMVLHSSTNRIAEMGAYKDNPISLADYDILIITSARIIIEPYELFISYNTGKREFMLIDEMINYYPQPFEIPREIRDIVTFIDSHKTHNGKSGVECEGGFYQHCYQDINQMWAAYGKSGYKLFRAKNELARYKTEYIFNHILKNGIVPIRGRVNDFADGLCCILFDGTADNIFRETDQRILSVEGFRYSSDIEFIQFDIPFKRKNNENWNKNEFMAVGEGVIDMLKGVCSTGKSLIVTWKSLDIFKGVRNEGVADTYELAGDKVKYNFPKLLGECLMEAGISSDCFSIIYRGSGLDRGSNEYRDFQNIVFLGEWHIPDNIVGDINKMFGCRCSFKDYMKSLVIQTICRIQIRKHSGLPIKVYFSSDIDYNLMEEVQEYFIKNSPSTCKIGGVMKPCKRYSKPEKNCIMDMISLYSYDPKIRDSIENETHYSFDITLDELYNLIPKKRKAKDRYNKLCKYLNDRGVNMNIT